MKFDMPGLRQLPIWILLFALGAATVAIGASTEISISGNSIRLASPTNYVLIGIGIVFVVVGIIELRRHSLGVFVSSLPVESISIEVLDFAELGRYPRVRIRGKVTPPVSGVRVWILREHLGQSPGKFHVGAEAALTDKSGEWQQFTYLWKGGKFRIHAMIVEPDSEMLFEFYRAAYDRAREVYRKEVNSKASSFPGWPFLDSLPSKSVSDYSEIVV